MLFTNRYCFFSDIIEGHVLIFDSMNNKYVVLNEREYRLIANQSSESDNSDSIEYLVELGILGDSQNYHFNVDKYRKKIEQMRVCMKNMYIFTVMMDDYNDNDWLIDESRFIECIKAIDDFCQTEEIGEVKIYLSCTRTVIQIDEYLSIIGQIMSRIICHAEVAIINPQKNKTDIFDDKVQNEYEKNVNPEISDNLNSSHKDALQSYERKIAAKSMKQYYEVVKNNLLFSRGFDSFELLCPCLIENYYIIEHGVFIKKCPHKKVDQTNIVGFVDKAKLIFNRNIRQFILSADRLHDDCKKCDFVYLCMGQNCKVCPNAKIITCMPMRRTITRKLNQLLNEYLVENV